MLNNLRYELINEVDETLRKINFETQCYDSICFDIVAKKINEFEKLQKSFLFLKILLNIDSIQFQQAKNLKILSNFLDAFACIVGIQTRYEKLKDNIIYERFDLPAFTLGTLKNILLDSEFQYIYRDRGGFFVKIDPNKLKKMRREKNLTQKELAEKIGVSKKSVYEHEKKETKATYSLVIEMEKILGDKISTAIKFDKIKFKSEMSKPKNMFEKNISNHFKKIGFDVTSIDKAPFNLIANLQSKKLTSSKSVSLCGKEKYYNFLHKEKFFIFNDVEIDRTRVKRNIHKLKNFSVIIKKPVLVITKEKIREEYNVPVIEESKLKSIGEPEELFEIFK